MTTVSRDDWTTRALPCMRAAAFAVALLMNGAVAQETESPPTSSLPLEPQSLAEGSYAERQRATLEMWRQRSTSRQAVQDAARDSDPEVAERAEWILRQWRNGTLPGTIQGPIGSLMQVDDPSALAGVLQDGLFRVVQVAVEESAGTIEFEQVKARVANFLVQRFPIYVDRAVNDGTELDLLKLVETVAIDRSLADSWLGLRDELGVESDTASSPSAAKNWEVSEQHLFDAQCAMLRGDVDEAIEHARRSGDPVSIRITQMLGERWDLIGRESIEAAEDALDEHERYDLFAWALAAADRSGDRELRALAIEKLTADENTQLTEETKALRWHSLVVHGEIDKAIDVLEREDRALAATIAVSASRFTRAIELIGLPHEDVDSELENWIDAAIDEQTRLPQGEIADDVRLLSAYAKLLLHLGRRDDAKEIYRRLAIPGIIVGDRNQSMVEWLLDEMLGTNRLDWMIELAVSKRDNTIKQMPLVLVAWGMDVEPTTIALLCGRLKTLMPRSSFQTRFRAACRLLRGELPEGFESPEDFERLYQMLVQQPTITRSSGGRVFQSNKITLNEDLLEMLAYHGQMELSREGFQRLADDGDTDALIRLAELEVEQGDTAKALELWGQVAEQSAELGRTQALVTLDHGLAFAKSVVGKWLLARRAGHVETANDLERRLRLMLHSPSLKLRKELADYLRTVHRPELAAPALRDLVIQTSYGGDDAPDFFYVARSYAAAVNDVRESQSDRMASLSLETIDIAKWSDLAILGILETDRFPDSLYVSLPLIAQKAYLEYAVEVKDATIAENSIRKIESLDRLNIDYAERILPDLRDAGLNDVADAAFDRLFESGVQHTERFGTDATSLNNVAWAAATNGVRLDEALRLSEQAVFLEPDSVVYRDTLAEVLFQLGRVEEALAIESACLVDTPDDWHLHEQVKKYREHLKSADSP